jgi:amino acid permease
MNESSARVKVLAIAFLVIGVALLVVGVIYFTVAADKLPSFLGHLATVTKHRTRRGEAGIGAGVICLIVSGLVFYQAGRRGAEGQTPSAR